MHPSSLRQLGRKLIAAALALAVPLVGTGPVYAQEIRAVTRSGAGSVSAEAGTLSLPNVLAPLAPSAMGGAALTPTLAVPTPTPSAAGP